MSDSKKLEKQVDPHGKGDRTAKATIVGAAIAALAASACCILPAVFAIVGASSVGLAAAFAPYRPLLLAVTVAMLGAGFYFVYRRPRAATTDAAADGATDACGCAAPRTRRSGKLMLWMASAFVVLLAAFPYISAATATTSKNGSAVETSASKQVTLRVSGMSCAGCASTITKKLAATPGVVRASVSFPDSTATAVYNPNEVSPAQLAAAVATLDGYKAEVLQ